MYVLIGPSWSWSYGSWIYNYLYIRCLSPLKFWIRTPLMARCMRYNIEKVCQWLATCQWFSLGTPVSSINKTDRHNIAEILLKVTLITINQTKPYVLPEYHHRNKKIVNNLGISSYINTHYLYIQTEVTKVIQTCVLFVSQTHMIPGLVSNTS